MSRARGPLSRAAASDRRAAALSDEQVAQPVFRIRIGVPEAAGAARGRAGLATFLACGVLSAQASYAANPQPYKVDWVSSGDKAIDSTMKLTSQLETLQKTAQVDPFGLIARARGDVTRLQTVLQSFGYYDGAITITINGMGLDNRALADAVAALPKKTDAHVKVNPTLGPLFHIGRIDIKGALPSGMREKMDLSPGAPSVASEVLAAGGNLQAALQDAGYAFATVDKPVAYEVPAQHVLNLIFPVTTGPRVSIGAIGIKGLKEVHESLLRRRLLVRTGELYDAAAIEKARQDLLSLGLFSTVRVKLGGADQEQRVPITFVVQEAKKYTIGVSAAYSSDLGGSSVSTGVTTMSSATGSSLRRRRPPSISAGPPRQASVTTLRSDTPSPTFAAEIRHSAFRSAVCGRRCKPIRRRVRWPALL